MNAEGKWRSSSQRLLQRNHHSNVKMNVLQIAELKNPSRKHFFFRCSWLALLLCYDVGAKLLSYILHDSPITIIIIKKVSHPSSLCLQVRVLTRVLRHGQRCPAWLPCATEPTSEPDRRKSPSWRCANFQSTRITDTLLVFVGTFKMEGGPICFIEVLVFDPISYVIRLRLSNLLHIRKCTKK